MRAAIQSWLRTGAIQGLMLLGRRGAIASRYRRAAMFPPVRPAVCYVPAPYGGWRALRSNPVRLVIATCSVDYEGRLGAHLPPATRLLLIKADGSVSVHADGGAYKPLNWM